MKKLIAAAALAVIGATSAAFAADMATKAPIYNKAPPAVVSDWTGWYVGINGGYGWADPNDWAAPNFGGPTTPIGSAKAQGGLVGGQVGYNWQVTPNWVLGI